MKLPFKLFFPEPLSSGSGAGVDSPGGEITPPANPSEDFYSKSTPADAPTGGETVDFTSGKSEVSQPNQGKAETPVTGAQGEVKTPAVPPVAPSLKLDAETIAELRKGLAPAAPAAPEQPVGMSREQLKELLNPVEVGEQFLAGISHDDPNVRLQTFQDFAKATVKNAVSISRVMIQQARQEFERVINPLSQHIQTQQLNTAKETFFAAHKELADPKYDKVIQAAAREVNHLRPDGSAKSDTEIMKEVADSAKSYLQTLGVNFQSPANPGAGGGSLVPKPNRLSSSGRSGGDNNGQSGKSNNPDADIYNR